MPTWARAASWRSWFATPFVGVLDDEEADDLGNYAGSLVVQQYAASDLRHASVEIEGCIQTGAELES